MKSVAARRLAQQQSLQRVPASSQMQAAGDDALRRSRSNMPHLEEALRQQAIAKQQRAMGIREPALQSAPLPLDEPPTSHAPAATDAAGFPAQFAPYMAQAPAAGFEVRTEPPRCACFPDSRPLRAGVQRS